MEGAEVQTANVAMVWKGFEIVFVTMNGSIPICASEKCGKSDHVEKRLILLIGVEK